MKKASPNKTARGSIINYILKWKSSVTEGMRIKMKMGMEIKMKMGMEIKMNMKIIYLS